MIFWKPSIPKDLLGRKFGENHFYSHRGAPFCENLLKIWKIAILTPLKKHVPSPIEWWSVTKGNQIMSWNYQIIRSLDVIGLWKEKKLKNFFRKKDFFWKIFQFFFLPEPYYIQGLNNLVISGHDLVPFCYGPSFYRGRNILFERGQNGYFSNFE